MIGPEPNEPSVKPQATGAAEHLAAAEREEQRLARHRELFDPNAKQSIRRCRHEPSAEQQDAPPDCWVETVNPTAIHEAEMKVHGRRAVYHRKAARELHAGEKEACAGIPLDAREANPFGRGHILGVSPLQGGQGENGREAPLLGATVYLQPMSEVAIAELQRHLDCYSAHQAVIGYGPITTDADRSPLSEPGARASVREVTHAYAVDVQADDEFAAQAIWLRAQRLSIVQ